MRRSYSGQFEPWRPFYMVIPTNEYILRGQNDSGRILAAALIVNRFIFKMTGAMK